MTTSSPQEFLLITTFAPDGNSTFMEKKKKKKKKEKERNRIRWSAKGKWKNKLY